MGCCGGEAADEEAPPARPPAKMASQKSSVSGKLPSRTASQGSGFGPLSRDQYVSRLTHSGTVLETKVPLGHGASYTLQYAYVSQRRAPPRRLRARATAAARPPERA